MASQGNRINQVTNPEINLFYRFPNAQYQPMNVLSPVPSVLPSTEPSFVQQVGQLPRLSGTALRQYLSQYISVKAI